MIKDKFIKLTVDQRAVVVNNDQTETNHGAVRVLHRSNETEQLGIFLTSKLTIMICL